MSYCRFSEGDVYLIAHSDGLWSCYLCKLRSKRWIVTLNTLGEVQDHLQAHRDAGHKVPDRAFAIVEREIALYGGDYVNPHYVEGQSYEEGGQCLKLRCHTTQREGSDGDLPEHTH